MFKNVRNCSDREFVLMKFIIFSRRVSYFIHIGLVCIAAYAIYYAGIFEREIFFVWFLQKFVPFEATWRLILFCYFNLFISFALQVQYYRSTGDDSSLSSSEIKIPQSAQYSSDNEWEMNNLAAENELVDTIINERYLVGDVIAVGRTATVRSGKFYRGTMYSKYSKLYDSFPISLIAN